MHRWVVSIVAASVGSLVLSAAPAQAGWVASPFAGVTFSGDAATSKPVFGGSIGWMGPAMIGFDVDFGYTSDFFKDNNLGIDFYDKSHLATMTVNALVAVPTSSKLHPYGVIGLGAIWQKAEDPAGLLGIDHTDLGMDIGGGAWWDLTDMVALRGDVRYFHALQNGPDGTLRAEDGKFNTWRIVGGVTFTH
jgi:opacity protein-like surface antigen